MGKLFIFFISGIKIREALPYPSHPDQSFPLSRHFFKVSQVSHNWPSRELKGGQKHVFFGLFNSVYDVQGLSKGFFINSNLGFSCSKLRADKNSPSPNKTHWSEGAALPAPSSPRPYSDFKRLISFYPLNGFQRFKKGNCSEFDGPSSQIIAKAPTGVLRH